MIILPELVFAETQKDPLTPGGPITAMWDQFDVAFKNLLIGGVLVGYRSGFAAGVAAEHRKLLNDTDTSRTEANKLTAQAQSLFLKPVSFYVQETEKFLASNPACKKMQLTRFLDQLAHSWASSPMKKEMGYDFIEGIDYKDVEQVCSE